MADKKNGKNSKKKEENGGFAVRELLRVRPESFRLADIDPEAIVAGPQDKEDALEELATLEPQTEELHERLWAAAKGGSKQRLLILLQGTDTAGKGGASKAIDRLLNPLGFHVVGFGPPTPEEKRHHFLWRHELQLPEPGRIRLFDRSHYEQVLVVRVRNLEPWQQAYDEINAWEARLVADGLTILKLLLHISKEEQTQRLLARLDDPTKHWKYNPNDVLERQLWDDYQAAFQEALVRCSTDAAPWYVVPANRKWHRDWLVSHLLLETLEAINPQYPPSTLDVAVEKARVQAS